MSERLIGHVCIDTGTIAVGDPCRLDRARDVSKQLLEPNADLSLEDDGIVASVTGIGDGRYPVYIVTEDLDGSGLPRVAGINIDFLSSPWDGVDPPAKDGTSKHRQVLLPELGFTVDEGLEDLIRACWRRGIATLLSCIGSGDPNDWHAGDGCIIFANEMDANRWERVTGLVAEWTGDMEVVSACFPAAEIPALVSALNDDAEQLELHVSEYHTRFMNTPLIF